MESNVYTSRTFVRWMRWFGVSFLFIAGMLNAASAQVTVSGALSGNGSYTTLGAAITAIGTSQAGANIVITITGNTTEGAGTISIGAGTWATMQIVPSGGSYTISAATTAGLPMIDFNGADNVTINGNIGGVNSLTIQNTTVSATSGTSTIRFQTDATNNTITYCNILGSSTMATTTNGGNIWFGAAAVTTGNDNNTISFCNIGPAGTNLPTKAIYGNGTTTTTTLNNSGITITNNNIYDFFNAAAVSNGVYIGTGNTDWTISNNRLYQTATRTQTTGALHAPIQIATTAGNNFQITGNTIGYSSSAGTGTYTFVGVSSSSVFIPINLSVGTTTATSVQGNTITGIAMSGLISGTSSSSSFRGIYVSSGLVYIGATSAGISGTGNTIGSLSSTGAITMTTTSASAYDFRGIFNFSTASTIMMNNNIGGITLSSSSTGACNFYGVSVNTSSSANSTISGNTVGGTVANSVLSNSTATGTIMDGILVSTSNATVTNNTVRNITASGGTGTSTTSSVGGIVVNASSNNHTVTGNTIFNLANTNTTANTWVSGLVFSSSTGTNLIARNFVHSLSVASTLGTPTLNGIYVVGGTATYQNNMVRLGIDGSGNSVTTGCAVNGIFEVGGTNNFSHNSVYVGGTGVGTLTNNTFAFRSSVTTNLRSFRNNIFVNERSNASTGGKHYAVTVGGTLPNPSGLVIDYNIYSASGTGSVFGLYNALDVATLAAWRTAVGQDVNSWDANPQFQNPTGAAAAVDLHINPSVASLAEGLGTLIASVTDDFDGQTRSTLTPVDIGADAGNFTPVPVCSGTPTAGTITGPSATCSGSGVTLTLSGATTDLQTTYQWASSTTSGGPYTDLGTALTQATGPQTAPTYYVVTVTCTASGQTSTTSEFTLGVNALPTVSVSPTSGTYCSPGGAAVALTGSGASTYAWSPATGLNATTGTTVNASPSVATTYTVTGTDGNGCIATATTSIAVSGAVAISSATATPSSICSGANSQLNVSASVTTAVSAYAFSAGTGATLDPMTGATTVIGSGNDDTPNASPLSIGFTFNFNGTSYTQYSVSPDGWLLLGGTAATNQFTNQVTSTTNIPKIYPYWDDLATGTDGWVKTLVTGTAPNRIFIAEWKVTIPRNTAGASNSTFQVWLYETTGVVEIRYGAMGAGTMSASTGMTGGATNFQSVTVASGTASTSVANDANAGQPASGTIYTFSPSTISSYAWSPATFLNNAAIANPLASAVTSSTTYTVTATSTGGCTASATVTLTAGDPLSSSITPASASICLGQSGTLTANTVGGGAPFTYSWSDGTNVVGTTQAITGSPSATTTFTVSITDACGQTTSSTVTVTVNPIPSVSVTNGTPVLCGGAASSLLTASGADTYTWSPATGLNATTGSPVTSTAAATTTYTVVGTTTATGCTATATTTVTRGIPVSTISASANPTGVCNLGSSNLSSVATGPQLGTYTLSSIPYAPIAEPGSGVTTLAANNAAVVALSTGTLDDGGWNGRNIGFTFNFFGTDYTQFGVGCNGVMYLGATANSFTGYSNAWPYTFAARPGIAVGFADLDFRTAGPTSSIKYWVDGVAPNRKLVVQWTNGQFYLGVSGSVITQQAILYEGTDVIEIHTTNITRSTATQVMVEGIQNAAGTVAYTVSGRNGTAYSVSTPDAYRFTPDRAVISTYSWSPSDFLNDPNTQNPVASLMTSTTTYTVTATEASGCTASATVTVTVGDPLAIASTASPSIICTGQTSTLSAIVISGGGPFTYSWSDGTNVVGTTASISPAPSATTTFTVTVTDACGGSQTSTTAVTVNPIPTVSVTNSNPLLCGGTASTTLTASGADTYAWAPGTGLNATTGATVTSTAAATTTYTVTGTTTATGCTATATTTVTRGLPVTSISASASPTVICPGQDASLSSTASGPALGTYTLSTITYGLQPTTGFTALGGGDDIDLATAVPLPFTLNYFGTNQTAINIGSNGYVYFGTPNGGSILSAGVNNGINIFAADMLPAAGQVSYGTVGVAPNRIFVIDWNGMPEFSGGGTHSGQVQIYENGGRIEIHVTSATSATRTKTLGIKNATGTVTYIPTGFGSTTWTVSTPTAFRFAPDLAVISSYSWSPAGDVVNPSSQNTATNPLSSTTVFTVTASEASGCTASATVTVTVAAGALMATPTATPATLCPGGSTTLSAGEAGGCPAYTYDWSDGTGSIGTTASLTISPTASGTYTVTVTDFFGTTATGTVSVAVNSNPTVAVTNTNPSLCAPITSSTLTASGADTYAWSPAAGLNATTGSTVTATPSATTVYTVVGTVTATGCTASATTTVTLGVGFSTITATASPANVCVGGSSTLNAAATFPTCSAYYSVNTTGYGLQPTTGFTPLVGCDDCDLATGVTLPFTFNFFGTPQTTINIGSNGYVYFGTPNGGSILPAGVTNGINIFAADMLPATGQVSYGTVGVSPNQIFVIDWNAMPEFSGGGTHTGQIQIFQNGRIEIHVASASSSTRTKTLGVRNAAGTDNTYPAGFSSTAWTVSTPTAWAFTQCFSATASSYTWSPATFLNDPNIASPVASTLPSGANTYTVTITNSTGCTATASVTVDAGVSLSATASASPAIVCSGNATSLTATVTGGGQPYTYDWSDGAGSIGTTSPLTVNPTASGIYTVTVTDACGSTVTATTSVTLFTTPSVSISGPAGICSPGAVTLTASGATSYLWSTSETTVSIFPTVSTTTTYTVTGTSVDGCTATATWTVVIPSASTTTATATPSSICSGGTSQLNAVATYPPPTAPTYCVPTQSGSSCVSNVTINTLNSTVAACVSPYYRTNAPTGTNTTTLMPGSTYTVGVTCTGTAIVSVWIDFNRNGVYEATEWVQPFTNAVTGTASITVPSGASIGQTGMRVRSRLSGNTNGSGDACSTFGSGSTEDYVVTIGVPISGSFSYSWSPATGLNNALIQNPQATITSSTLYTVTATDAYGCTSTAQVLVSVNPLFLSAAAAPTTVCAGANVSLTSTVTGGGEPYTYSWSDGTNVVATTANPMVNPTTTSTYTLTLTDACGTTLTATTAAVTVNPAPGVSVTPSSALYCPPVASALTASSGTPGTTFAWSPATGLNATTGATVNASPTASTTYTITATGTNGCTSTATVAVTTGTAITVDATADTTQSCSPLGTILRACVNPAFNTYNLDSSNTDYTPTGPTAFITLSSADDGDAAVTLPFSFNFFGTTYTGIRVGSNGYITMGTSAATSLTNQTLPSATAPNGVIAMCWDDLLHSGTATGVDTFTVGTAPNRKFIVRYNAGAVAFYNAGSQTGSLGGKIILHEGTGIVEVRIDVMNKGVRVDNQTLGIENASGTAGITPAGKNNADWTQSTPITYRFSPAARQCNNSGITFTWSPATALNTTSADTAEVSGLTSTTQYTVTALNASGCAATDTVTLIVFPQAPTPTITASGPLSFCPGGSVTLTSSNTSFPNNWSTGATTVSITVNSTQTVTLTAQDAFCPSAPVSVNVLRYDTIQPLINVSGGGLAICDGTRDLLADGAPQFTAWNWSTSETSQQITITTPGTYGVSATDLNGCLTYNQVTFVAGQTPVAPVISTTSNDTVCNNDPVTITSDLTDGLTWFPTFDNTASITYNLSPPGFYEFYVTRDSLGCTAESNHLTFVVNPTPDVTSISPADSACVGDVITLNGAGFLNVTGISFNGTPATSFTVVDDFTITVTVPAGATSGGITLTDGLTGCAGVSPLFTVKVVCGSTLNMTAFIQGYYNGGTMVSPLFNNGVSPNATDCDTIKVCLMDAGTYAEIECATGILQTDGTVSLSFTSSGSYYLRVTHQNAIQTWSAAPVTVSGTSSYDFTTDNLQSYGPNMVEVSTGVWGFYSGDVNQDELIEATDYSIIENDVINFGFGYLATDLTGDGLVEAADYGLIENNVPLFIFSAHP